MCSASHPSSWPSPTRCAASSTSCPAARYRLTAASSRSARTRIREAKATGLANLPCHAFHANAAWLEIILAAIDLVAWAKLIGFIGHPEIARCEIPTFRYRVLHTAARITRGARQTRLRIDATWRWAAAIATAWQRIRAAFP